MLRVVVDVADAFLQQTAIWGRFEWYVDDRTTALVHDEVTCEADAEPAVTLRVCFGLTQPYFRET